MLLHIVIYAGEVLLVEHAELDLLGGCGDDEIECVAQNSGVRYAVYGGEVEKGKRLLEAVEDADGGEEQVAWFSGSARIGVSSCIVPTYPLCFLGVP